MGSFRLEGRAWGMHGSFWLVPSMSGSVNVLVSDVHECFFLACMGGSFGLARMRVVHSLARGKRTKCKKMGLAVLVKRGGDSWIVLHFCCSGWGLWDVPGFRTGCWDEDMGGGIMLLPSSQRQKLHFLLFGSFSQDKRHHPPLILLNRNGFALFLPYSSVSFFFDFFFKKPHLLLPLFSVCVCFL